MRFEVFYKQIKELNINALQVEDKYNQLEKKVNNFVSGLNSLMLNAKDYQEVKNIEKTFNNIKENLSYSIQRWQSDFNQKQKHERFRDKLKNKFIVIIYGKVKAGKSTLGNFVANNNPSGVKPEKIEKIERDRSVSYDGGRTKRKNIRYFEKQQVTSFRQCAGKTAFGQQTDHCTGHSAASCCE